MRDREKGVFIGEKIGKNMTSVLVSVRASPPWTLSELKPQLAKPLTRCSLVFVPIIAKVESIPMYECPHSIVSLAE